MTISAKKKMRNIFPYIIFLILGGVFLYGGISFAATTTWTGANSSDWTDAGNWSGGVPTSTTDVVIPDASTTSNDPNIASGAVCLSMTIDASGILNGNAQTITVYGNWTNNGTYNHGNGTIEFRGSVDTTFTPGSSSYYNIVLNKTGYDDLNISGTATVLGNITQTDGDFGQGQMDLAGDYIIGASSNGGTSYYLSTVINFNGAGDQAIVYNSGGTGAQIRVAKTSGTLTISSDIVICGWTYVSGTVVGYDTYDLIFGDDNHGTFAPGGLVYNNLQLNKPGGYSELQFSGTATVTGNFTHIDGELANGQMDLAGDYIIGSAAGGGSNYYNATVINMDGAGDQAITYSTGGIGGHIRIDKSSGILASPADLTVNSWTYVKGTVSGFSGGTLTFGDDNQGTFAPGSLAYNNITVNIGGLYQNLVVSSGTYSFNSLTVSSGNLYLSTNNPTIALSGNLTISASGTLFASSNPITVRGSWTNGGTFSHNNGLIIFGGSVNGTFTPGSSTYKDIQINKTASDWDFDHITVSGTATVAGNLTHTDGRMLGGQIDLAGNYTISPTAGDGWYGSTATTVNFNHTSNDQSIIYNGGYGAQIRVDKAGGSLIISSDIVVSGWSYVQGTVVGLATYKLTLGGSATGNFVPGSLAYGNVEINKTSSDWDYHRVVVSGTGTISGNLIHTRGRMNGGQLDLRGDYIIAATANDGWYGSTGTIINFNDTDDQAIQYTAGGIGAQVRVDKASGTLSIGSDISVGGWIYVQGTVNTLSSRTLTLAGSSDGSFIPGSLTYGNIIVNKSHFDTDYDDLTVGTGTLSVTGDLTLTDGQVFFSTNNTTVNINGSVSIAAAAAMNAGSNTITVGGNWTNSGTFTHGSGKILFAGTSILNAVFTPGNSTYKNIEINKTNHYGAYDNLSVSGTATLAGNLIHTEGEFVNGQFDLTAGNYIVPATADGTQGGYTTTIVNFIGTADQTITYSAGGIGVNIRIDKASGTFVVPSDIVICSWTYIRGAVSGLDTYELIFGDDNHGTFTPGALTYNDIQLNKPGTYDDFSVSGTATLTGDFTHTDGDLNGGVIDLTAGDYIVGSSAAGVSSNSGVTICYIAFTGSADQSIIYNAGGIGGGIKVDKPSGNLIISDDLSINSWNYVRGSVSGLDSHKLIFTDDSVNSGVFTPGGITYGDIKIYRTYHNGSYEAVLITSGTLNIDGDLEVAEGKLRLDSYNPSINMTGNFIIGASLATIIKGTGTITFNGTAPSTYTDSSSPSQNIGKIVLGKTNPTSSQNKLTLLSGLNCDTFIVSSDNTLDTGIYTLTLSNAGSTATVFTQSGTLTGTGKIKYAATNSAGNVDIVPTTYHDLELSGAETYVLSGTVPVSGDITVGASSILSPGTSSVNLTGSDQTISGNASFYDLAKDITSLSTLTFSASSTTSILNGGTLTLKGEDRNNRLLLRSSVEDTPWNLDVDPAASYDFDYLDVQDSTASRTLTVLNSIDSGGNTNWSITNNTAPVLTVPAASVSAGIVTITATAADIDQDDISIKAEYSTDGTLWQDPVLSTPVSSLGSINLDNTQEYQLSGIPTTSSNYFSFQWDTRQILTYEENLLIRLTPYDGTDAGSTVQTQAFLLNNRSGAFVPTRPDLSALTITGQDGILHFQNLPASVTEVAVSITPDFSSSSYQPIAFPIPISSLLYLKFRTRSGAVSDTITYIPNTDLLEGDIVKTPDNPDVYIIKYKGGKAYKRLILSPSVFDSYRHLKWSNLKLITQSRMDTFITSNLVYVEGDSDIYILTPLGDTGRRTILDKSTVYDPDSVYEINEVDRGSYGG